MWPLWPALATQSSTAALMASWSAERTIGSTLPWAPMPGLQWAQLAGPVSCEGRQHASAPAHSGSAAGALARRPCPLSSPGRPRLPRSPPGAPPGRRCPWRTASAAHADAPPLPCSRCARCTAATSGPTAARGTGVSRSRRPAQSSQPVKCARAGAGGCPRSRTSGSPERPSRSGILRTWL